MLIKDQPIVYVRNQTILDKVLYFLSFRIDNKELTLLFSKNLETEAIISPMRYFQIVI